jgi:hypothetical protein
MNRHTIARMTIGILFAFTTAARAELRHVDIKTLGMD